MNNFRESGSVERKKGSGRPTKRTAEVIDNVRVIMEATPSKPLRKLRQEVDLSYGTCRTILKKDLSMFPYKMQMFHQLLPRDFQSRINYCQWFLNNINNNDILNLTWFTDEAWFHLDGYLNSQNMRTWATDNPHMFVETPLHEHFQHLL